MAEDLGIAGALAARRADAGIAQREILLADVVDRQAAERERGGLDVVFRNARRAERDPDIEFVARVRYRALDTSVAAERIDRVVFRQEPGNVMPAHPHMAELGGGGDIEEEAAQIADRPAAEHGKIEGERAVGILADRCLGIDGLLN